MSDSFCRDFCGAFREKQVRVKQLSDENLRLGKERDRLKILTEDAERAAYKWCNLYWDQTMRADRLESELASLKGESAKRLGGPDAPVSEGLQRLDARVKSVEDAITNHGSILRKLVK